MITLDEFVNQLNQWLQITNNTGLLTLSREDLKQIADALECFTFEINKNTTRHGHWEPIVNYRSGKRDGRYWCSECRQVVNKYETYCPACGAYMLKESKINE